MSFRIDKSDKFLSSKLSRAEINELLSGTNELPERWIESRKQPEEIGIYCGESRAEF